MQSAKRRGSNFPRRTVSPSSPYRYFLGTTSSPASVALLLVVKQVLYSTTVTHSAGLKANTRSKGASKPVSLPRAAGMERTTRIGLFSPPSPSAPAAHRSKESQQFQDSARTPLPHRTCCSICLARSATPASRITPTVQRIRHSRRSSGSRTTTRMNGEHSSKTIGRFVRISHSILASVMTITVCHGKRAVCMRFRLEAAPDCLAFRVRISARCGIRMRQVVR